MTRSGLTRSFVLPALVAFLAGCGKDNPTGLDDRIPFYADLSSPQNVLTDLTKSYSVRDSVETKLLYDSTYVGTSRDLNLGTLDEFRYADEVSHVAALARAVTITDVICDFGPIASWTRLPSSDPSHPEWATIQFPGGSIRIEIFDGSDSWVVTSSGEVMSFQFSPTTPASSSPTDTLWKIVRWEEVHSTSP